MSDLLGLVTNSGIGTATSYTSLVLASSGHDVTLVHTRNTATMDPSWEERYRSAGVGVEQAPPMIVAPGHLAASYRVYEHLRNRDFDTIVFQDWLALGWASVQAKRAGLAFSTTQLVHISHGPDAWLLEANLQVAIDAEHQALAHAGQVSAEFADAVVGPSRYLLDWMSSAGWQLPARTFVVPYFTDGHACAALGRAPLPDASVPAGPAPLREIAFFGRLERRKGVHVFVEALNRIDGALLDGVTISFLGREATFKRHDVLAMFEGPLRRAAAAIDFHTGFDNEAACRHLARPGTVAVIASLVDNSPNTIYECLERGISFIATSTGGTPELLRDEDRARCLVPPEPEPLADALRAALVSGATPEPARPAFDMGASLHLWDEILAWESPPRVEVRESPLVTAVLTHHDRPALITTAAEAVDAQDYANLEIVVVDDGSVRPESHQILNRIADHRWRHPLEIVRQENLYLGAARNAGAAAGRGDLIVFVDDDDVPVDKFVSTLVRSMQVTGADAVTCAMRSFTKPIGVPEEADSRGTWVFAGGPLHLAAVQNCIGGAPAMVRRSALEAIGGYHERYGVGYEDWHLYVRLLFAGYTVVAIPEPLYWYRLHEHSMRNTMSDYHSAQMILDVFRSALPPTLQPLVDLAYGQGLVTQERLQELSGEVDLRDRVLWLAEERLERREVAAAAAARPVLGVEVGDLAGNPSGNGKLHGPVVDGLRRSLGAARRRLGSKLPLPWGPDWGDASEPRRPLSRRPPARSRPGAPLDR